MTRIFSGARDAEAHEVVLHRVGDGDERVRVGREPRLEAAEDGRLRRREVPAQHVAVIRVHDRRHPREARGDAAEHSRLGRVRVDDRGTPLAHDAAQAKERAHVGERGDLAAEAGERLAVDLLLAREAAHVALAARLGADDETRLVAALAEVRAQQDHVDGRTPYVEPGEDPQHAHLPPVLPRGFCHSLQRTSRPVAREGSTGPRTRQPKFRGMSEIGHVSGTARAGLRGGRQRCWRGRWRGPERRRRLSDHGSACAGTADSCGARSPAGALVDRAGRPRDARRPLAVALRQRPPAHDAGDRARGARDGAGRARVAAARPVGFNRKRVDRVLASVPRQTRSEGRPLRTRPLAAGRAAARAAAACAARAPGAGLRGRLAPGRGRRRRGPRRRPAPRLPLPRRDRTLAGVLRRDGRAGPARRPRPARAPDALAVDGGGRRDGRRPHALRLRRAPLVRRSPVRRLRGPDPALRPVRQQEPLRGLRRDGRAPRRRPRDGPRLGEPRRPRCRSAGSRALARAASSWRGPRPPCWCSRCRSPSRAVAS